MSREKAPQEGRCACPHWSGPTECVRIRYGRNPTAGDPDDEPEECECPCHYDESDWLDDFESIHERSERRSDEALEWDGSERWRR